jgi:perosamine synthetase
MDRFIHQMEPLFGEEERLAMNDYMMEGGWLTEFKRTAEFERRIAEYTGAKHCVVVNNGTISLTLMGLAAGLQHGDEVLIPNFTMIATPNSAKMFGAKPVFVDVEPTTLCIDLEDVKKKVTSKTKALFLVNANGRYPSIGIDNIVSFCDENGIVLLEDSAQSLGSFYPDGKHQGTKGLMGSFSFSAPKIISTGQGGAIVTNSDEMNFKLRRLKDFGRSGGGNDIHDSIGFNFKFTELQAVIGVEQMKKLPWRVERKKEIYKLYQKGLAGLQDVQLFDQDLAHTTPWFIDTRVNRREELMQFLKMSNIGTRVMYPPVNRQEAYQFEGSFPVSEEIGLKGLWLPSAVQLTDDQIEYITQAISRFYEA